MIRDLMRFNREAPALVGLNGSGPSLGEFLDDGGYSQEFVRRLIVPQASAVWSADPNGIWEFPASMLAEFFANHGMFGLSGRPNWLTVTGGSDRYVEAITRPLGEPAAPVDAGSPRGAPRGPRGDHAVRRRARALRRGDLRRPLQPGAPDARRSDPRGGRGARRDPLPAQRGGPAHRPLDAPAAAARLGQLELPPARRAGRPDDRDVPHEPPAVAASRAGAVRDAQPDGVRSTRSR